MRDRDISSVSILLFFPKLVQTCQHTNFPHLICTGLFRIHLHNSHTKSPRAKSAAGGRKRESSSGLEGHLETRACSAIFCIALLSVFVFGRPLFFLSFLGQPPADCDWNSSHTVHVGAVCGSHLYTSTKPFVFWKSNCCTGRVGGDLLKHLQWQCLRLPQTLPSVLCSGTGRGVSRCGGASVIACDGIHDPYPHLVILPLC